MLGAGADDLILLCARASPGPGDTIAIPDGADLPALPHRRAARAAPRSATTTRCSRSPAGRTTRRRAAARCPTRGRSSSTRRTSSTAARRRCRCSTTGVIVLRTFSKAFGLAGARIGYALAVARARRRAERAAGAGARVDASRPRSRVAALASPPDVGAGDRGARAARRRRCARSGSQPLPSHANFLFVPVDDGRALGDALLRQGLVVRAYDDGDPDHDPRPRVDDDLLVEALARAARPARARRRAPAARRVRHLRATAETRIAVRLGLDGASRVRGRRPAPGSTTTSSSSSPSTPGSTSSSRAPATSRPATTTRSRTRRSRSARRSTARSATGAGSRATATRSCRWTTRSRAPPSTSAAGRSPS